MATYNVHFVHKVAPKSIPADSVSVAIGDNAFSDCVTLAKALRKARILFKGERVRSIHTQGAETVAFLGSSAWHALVISEAGSYQPAGIDYPGYSHLKGR